MIAAVCLGREVIRPRGKILQAGLAELHQQRALLFGELLRHVDRDHDVLVADLVGAVGLAVFGTQAVLRSVLPALGLVTLSIVLRDLVGLVCARDVNRVTVAGHDVQWDDLDGDGVTTELTPARVQPIARA